MIISIKFLKKKALAATYRFLSSFDHIIHLTTPLYIQYMIILNLSSLHWLAYFELVRRISHGMRHGHVRMGWAYQLQDRGYLLTLAHCMYPLDHVHRG